MRVVRGSRIADEARRRSQRRPAANAASEATARRIVMTVRRSGDPALRRYAERWDGLLPSQPLQVSKQEMEQALAAVPRAFRRALQQAARNIRRFCEWQKPREFRREMQPGICVGQVIRPLESVGCYVPGGRYPLPSSLLMAVIPAQVAGVKRIVTVSPRPAAETLAAAALVGVEEFFRIGGAQAISALAYGTNSIARVDKIVGPGNRYVTAAKKLIAFDCAIDFLAGPTEVAIVSSDGNPEFIAADLVAQAEHDPDASAIFITCSPALARAVAATVQRSVKGNVPAKESLRRNGIIFLCDSMVEMLELVNAIAPEHVTVPREQVRQIASAGSIFVGEHSPQALGDYASGPNHVLPTAGSARWRGGLSVLDFLKIITVQEASRAGLRAIAPVVQTLAEAEGLVAHAASVRVRCAHA
jgi:histidinol dehydrogenase